MIAFTPVITAVPANTCGGGTERHHGETVSQQWRVVCSRHTPAGHVLAMLYFVQAASQLANLLAVVKQATYPCHPNNNQGPSATSGCAVARSSSTPAPIFLNSEPKLSPVHCSVIMLLLCPCCVCPMTVPSAIRGCSASSRQGQVTMPVPRCHGNNLLYFLCVVFSRNYRTATAASTALVFPFSFFCARA